VGKTAIRCLRQQGSRGRKEFNGISATEAGQDPIAECSLESFHPTGFICGYSILPTMIYGQQFTVRWSIFSTTPQSSVGPPIRNLPAGLTVSIWVRLAICLQALSIKLPRLRVKLQVMNCASGGAWEPPLENRDDRYVCLMGASETRVLRSVLREAGGETPSAYSPNCE
jgi:hypothetical protein